MKIINRISPNLSSIEIPVEFLVLHYTACSLKKTLDIFLNPSSKVSSHFVIDTNGDCFDMGNFLNTPIRKGAHAGKSRIEIQGKEFSALNDVSIGIELVNLNGNIFPYTDEQYQTLKELISSLQSRFPTLLKSSRIVGHESIAGWRGKADPGLKFDWERLLKSVGLKPETIHTFHACNSSDKDFLEQKIQLFQRSNQDNDFWPQLSSALEKRIADR
jgi:N-acetyl-anhydromuramyl-L-alanine amidase AmpD